MYREKIKFWPKINLHFFKNIRPHSQLRKKMPPPSALQSFHTPLKNK